jgi:hypothetical protein
MARLPPEIFHSLPFDSASKAFLLWPRQESMCPFHFDGKPACRTYALPRPLTIIHIKLESGLSDAIFTKQGIAGNRKRANCRFGFRDRVVSPFFSGPDAGSRDMPTVPRVCLWRFARSQFRQIRSAADSLDPSLARRCAPQPYLPQR